MIYGNREKIVLKTNELMDELIELTMDKKNNEARINSINQEIEKNRRDLTYLDKIKDFSNENLSKLLQDKDSRTGKPIYKFKLSPSYKHCSALNFKGKTFYVIADNIFNAILHENLLEKLSQSSVNDENAQPEEIVNEINKILNVRVSENLVDYQRQASFMLVTTEENSKYLYIPLFRDVGLDKNKERMEFKSGLFHFLKHHSIKGRAIVGRTDKKELTEDFILLIIHEVFFSKYISKKFVRQNNQKSFRSIKASKISDINSKSKISLDTDRLNLLYTYELIIEETVYDIIFYYSSIFNLNFLSTVHINKKKTKELRKSK